MSGTVNDWDAVGFVSKLVLLNLKVYHQSSRMAGVSPIWTRHQQRGRTSFFALQGAVGGYNATELANDSAKLILPRSVYCSVCHWLWVVSPLSNHYLGMFIPSQVYIYTNLITRILSPSLSPSLPLSLSCTHTHVCVYVYIYSYDILLHIGLSNIPIYMYVYVYPSIHPNRHLFDMTFPMN